MTTPAVARNRGAAVALAVITEDGEPRWKPDGEMETEEVWLRFDLNVFAAIEEKYGSQAAWREAMEKTPALTVRWTAAACLARDTPTNQQEREVGVRLCTPDLLDQAMQGVMLAYLIANGQDPQMAASLVKVLHGAADAADIDKIKTMMESSLGTTGSKDGSEQEDPSMSSGD